MSKKIVLILGVVLFLFFFFLSAPSDFPVATVVRIEKGSSLRSVSLKLERDHIIRSKTAFEAFVVIFGGEKHIMYSDYMFEKKLPVFEVARRIVSGDHHMIPVVVTIPEGFDTRQIADAFTAKLVNFNKDKFLLAAKPLEGYLFPDTYFFSSTDTEHDVIRSMSENFNKRIKIIRPEIVSSGKSEKEIIVMASVIEREANGDSDRDVISGILWKRLAAGIPLQVDAVPETYKTKGLPESPVGNPGLEALKAAMHPQSSPYLYYLHDSGGVIHYARTFGEHIINKSKYLK